MISDENGILSIDFLAGFTIFMLAFIWVVSMIPGLMIGLQSYTIDYDAVAYRTGVILVEDPGWPVSPPWESYIDQQKSNVTRFGLAISKDTPNILSEDKVNRFFCATAFTYPDDYRTRVIFSDYPYGFNISLIDIGGNKISRGDLLPEGYGYIRRPVKIKGTSNATINRTYIQSHNFIKTDNATTHVFSILIDNPKLLGDISDPTYQIDPAREQITINITDLRSTITNYPPVINNTTSTIILKNIKVFKLDGGVYSNVPLPATDFPYIDGSNTRVTSMPVLVADNITLRISPQFFDRLKAQNSKIYIALGFTVNPESTFLNNTEALPGFDTLDGQLTFNNPNTTPFYYDYNPANVTQPYLRDAVVEVAVWSGAVTSSGGGGTTPINGTHTIYASAGSGGTISPIGSVSVSDGANQPFIINASANYHITNVVVDGASNGVISSYTFTNVNQDHTIAASFAIDQYTITPSVIGGNGTISPSTVQTVNYGATPTFAITPINAFYHITDVSVNGISVGTVTSYTFPAVTANYTINASFALGPAPAFTSITPASGPTVGGSPVTIVGTNFVDGGSFSVTIGGTPATGVVLVDSSHITAVTPAGTAGAQDVVIINYDGQTATGVGAYTYVATPTFASITPASGPTAGNTAVTIVGSNFVSGGSFGVTIGGTPATSVVRVDATHITALTPAGTAGAKDVVITNNDGQSATGTGAYTHLAPPTFASITPASGSTAGNTAVTIVGSNFVSGGSFGVTIGGTPATSVVRVDATHITALTPAGTAGAKDVVITNNDGQSATGTGAYTHLAPPPSLTVRNPTQGNRGWPVNVALTGTGFQPGATVNMTRGGVVINAYNIVVVSPNSITCTFDLVGATAANNWVIRVTNPDGQWSGTLTFTVNSPNPTITAITPASGQRGTTVTITNIAGTGFQPGVTEVRFSRDTGTLRQILLTNINVISSTQISGTLVIPAAHTIETKYVRVTNNDSGTGISGSRIFSVIA